MMQEDKATEREAKIAAKIAANVAKQKAKAAEREAEKAEKREAREAKKAFKANSVLQNKAQAKQERAEKRAEKARQLAERAASLKAASGRRPKATHILCHFDVALSRVQSASIRSIVLAEVQRMSGEQGRTLSIDDVQAACDYFLAGQSVRAYLSKLEETNHLTMVKLG